MACTKTRLLTQHNQENVQLPPDPFLCERVGSGDETKTTMAWSSPAYLVHSSLSLFYTISEKEEQLYIPSNLHLEGQTHPLWSSSHNLNQYYKSCMHFEEFFFWGVGVGVGVGVGEQGDVIL